MSTFTNAGPSSTTNSPSVPTFGNASNEYILSVSLSPASVAANTTAEQSFTISGLQGSDMAAVNKPSAQAGLGIVGCRVAANTLYITYVNATASPIVPSQENYLVNIKRPIAQQVSNGLPSSLPIN
jgi:hypothetical protein